MVNRRSLELALLSVGLLLCLKGGWNLAMYETFQSHPEWFVQTPYQVSPGRSDLLSLPVTFHSSHSLNAVTDLKVLGRLEVPRIGMSVLVVEGDEEEQLGLAAGHLSGSAPLGGLGNAVVAGHRDTSFWPLRQIRIGDRVRVRTGKTFDYIVSGIRIVGPDDVSVLRRSRTKTLTLVTCFPFRYFGSAPKRFIVTATSPRY